MKIKRRILAMLLVLVICMTTLATTAFAYADDPEDSTIPTEETTATEETEPSDRANIFRAHLDRDFR